MGLDGRYEAALPGVAYASLDAAHAMLEAAEAAAGGHPSMDHVVIEIKAARERAEIARDMSRRMVFAQGGAVVPRRD